MEGLPAKPPIGREVTATAKLLDRAFPAALAAEGGTVPSWLLLPALKLQPHRPPQDPAQAGGGNIRGLAAGGRRGPPAGSARPRARRRSGRRGGSARARPTAAAGRGSS